MLFGNMNILALIDTARQKETAKNVNKFLESLKESWEEAPRHFVTSAAKHLGKKGILQFITEENNVVSQHKKGEA